RFIFFSAPPSTPLYTLSLHDALPISQTAERWSLLKHGPAQVERDRGCRQRNLKRHQQQHVIVVQEYVFLVFRFAIPVVHVVLRGDRKSTRLNSSHVKISYAVFCLKKK